MPEPHGVGPSRTRSEPIKILIWIAGAEAITFGIGELPHAFWVGEGSADLNIRSVPAIGGLLACPPPLVKKAGVLSGDCDNGGETKQNAKT